MRPATLIKKRLWHRCFPVNFAKFWEHVFLQNTYSGCFSDNVCELSSYWNEAYSTIFMTSYQIKIELFGRVNSRQSGQSWYYVLNLIYVSDFFFRSLIKEIVCGCFSRIVPRYCWYWIIFKKISYWGQFSQ